MINNNILVSVIIISYNSADTILDTLESIKVQSYTNIELIISDDGSKDKTIEISENWLKLNSHCFSFSKLLTVESNTGISANCKKCVEIASGIWIKLLAADDMLYHDSINEYVSFAINNNYECIVSNLDMLKGNLLSNFKNKKLETFCKLDVNQKLKYYINDPFFLNTPSIFFKRELVLKIDPFEVKYKLVEDQPLFFNLLQNNVDFGYINKRLVIYRIHNNSISGSINKEFYRTLFLSYHQFRKPYINNGIIGNLLKYFIETNYEWLINKYQGNSIIHKLKFMLFQKAIKLLTILSLYFIVAKGFK